NPSITYSAVGNYDVTLISFDAAGCPDTMTMTDFVNIGGFEASFNMSDDTISVGEILYIDGPPAVQWEWTVLPSSATVNGSNDQFPTIVFDQPGSYSLCVSSTFDGCAGCNTAVKCTTVVVTGPTSIDARSNHHHGVLVYPNPSTGDVSFETFQQGILSMYDVMGRNVRQQEITGSVKLNGLVDGIYFYRFTSDASRIETGKFIVRKTD
ncbi:MAG TPA: T9SS type A sorting domain-containing protein, partial [Chitinophagales bacterium]|nr:T9SS type A sorting domain-containing protein [Chitinophagales bacterium]